MSQSPGKVGTEPVLEMSRLAELRAIQLPGEPDLVIELFDVFLQSSTKHLTGLTELWRARDLEKLQKEAHAFKSGARTLGAVRLGNACWSLEELCSSGTEAGVEDLVEKIRAEYQLLVAEIERVRNSVV